MPSTKELLRERSQVTALALIGKTVIYCTQYSGAKLLDANTFKLQKKIVHKELITTLNAVCFNYDGSLLAFATQNLIHILSLETKKIIKTIKVPKEKIDVLTFCDSYIIAGTSTGRVLQFRQDNSSQLARICSFGYTQESQEQNYVSSFSVQGSLLACSGQGGAIYTIDTYSQTTKTIIREKGERVNALCFTLDNQLIYADIRGEIFIHSLASNQLIGTIDAPFDNIKQIILLPDTNFIAIIGDANYLSIADIKKQKIAQANYAEFEYPVSKILLANDDSLLCVLDNYQIYTINLLSASKLRYHIMNNELLEAYNLCEREPILQNSKEYKLLEKRYKSLYKEAVSALVNQNKALALITLKPVKHIKSKVKELEQLLKAFENYNRFKVLYLEKKYSLAYAMSEKYEALQYTPLYIKIEETWRENFKNAQRHVGIGKIEDAKSLMQEYKSVTSKRPIIQLLLSQDTQYMKFIKALQTKDFQTVEELLLQNPLFEQTPTYTSLHKSIEKNMKTIDTLIQRGDLKKAKEMLLDFKNTSYINKSLKEAYTHLANMKKLQDAYEKNDFKSCYEILDQHHKLNISELGILLNKHWAKLMNQCEDYALKANPQGIKSTLNDLLLVQTRVGRIGDLLRVSFHSKIKAYLAKKSFNGAQNIIYSYIDIFGSDNEIKSLMRTYEVLAKKKLAITQDENKRVPRDKWLDSEVINSA